MTQIPSVVSFSDVKDSPKLRMSFPALLPIGYHIKISTVARRKNGHRSEEMKIEGEFRVVSSSLDTRGDVKQEVLLESLQVVPVWRSVKKAPPRNLPKTKSPRTPIT